jgi:copper transport protein
VFELLLQALDIDTSVGNVLSTQWGERWLYRNLLLIPIAALVAALAVGLSNRRLVAVLALADAAVYLVLTSSVSHAGAGGGSTWAIAADFVHLLTASVWIGMVVVLALVFRWASANLDSDRRYPVLSNALQRFSVVAAISVALLLLTGTVNAVIEVGRVGDLFDTDYGLVLTLKLVLLLPLLAIAGYNAYLLRPDFTEANDTTTNLRDRQSLLQDLERQLSRRIRYEAAVAIVVLVVVALLVQLTPTRGRIEAPDQGAGEYVENVDVDTLQVTFRITPNEPGFNTFEVYLAGDVYLDDGSDAVEGLRLEFTNPNGFASDSRLILDPSNPPTFYLGEGPFLSESGVWNIVLNIRRSAGLDLRPVFTVDVEDTAPVATGSRTGGSLDSPVDFNPGSVTLLALTAMLSVAVIVGSLPLGGRREGYLGWLAAEAAYRFAPVNVRPVWALGGLIAFGIALGLIVGNHLDKPLSKDEASRENPIEATQESIARGAMLFSQNCTICHGESGRGDGPAAATLPLQPANLYDHIPFHPDQFFFGVISKGLSGVMPAFEGQLSEEDRWNILNYLRDRFTEQPADR